MNTHADKTQENKSQSVANAVSQKQSGGESTFQFIDNRPKAIAQRKLQEMPNNSPQVKQLRAFQKMANKKTKLNQGTQLQTKEDNDSIQSPNSKLLLTESSADSMKVPASIETNSTPAIQMVQWTSPQTTAAGALAPALNAGYVLASANPGARPAMPAWVTARVQQGNPWDPVAERAVSDATAEAAWHRLPLAAHTHVGTQEAWCLNKSNSHYDNRMGARQAQWPITAAARWPNAQWGNLWNNQDGDLPGLAGAGGYAEYYAEPTGVIAAEGFWGRNRILRNTGMGEFENNWWATSDHYNNFTRIT